MRCKATTSPSSPANFVCSCTRPDESSALRAAPPQVVIPKSGTCRARSGCVSRLARIVPMHMCAWYHRHVSLVSIIKKLHGGWFFSELFSWVNLFLSRRCPKVSPSHVRAPLGGPSYLSGVPATRVAQQYTAPLCAAWGLAVRAAFEQWDWRQYLAGRRAVQALDYTARSGAPGCPPVDFCDPSGLCRPAHPFWGGEGWWLWGDTSRSLLQPWMIIRQTIRHLLRSPLPISTTMRASHHPGRNRLRRSSFLRTLRTHQGQGRSRLPGTGLGKNFTRPKPWRLVSVTQVIQRRRVEDALNRGELLDTTPTDVEKAYRRKCLKWHPDKWQTHLPEEQKKAEDTFKEIGLCRDILRGTSVTPAPTRDPG